MKNLEMTEEPAARDAERVDALDVVLVLARQRQMIGLATIIGLVLGFIFSLLLRSNFTANAVILPPQQQQSSASALLGQLGSLAALGGASMGLKTPADMYIGILQSRTIADEIIRKFHLEKVYKLKKMEDIRKALAAHTMIDSAKDGLIHISVTDHDPNRASEMANAYVDSLYGMNSNMAITEAAQRRVFFDQQLAEEKTALTAAEDDLRNTQLKTGLIQLSGQADMIIRSIAQLRAEIASRQVEMQSMRTFATEQNPEVNRLQEEINTLQGQLSKLEDDQQKLSPGDIQVPAGRVPQESLEYARKLREVRYHEALYELLAKQYEAARIDEAKSAPIIQVIDRAVPPDRKSGPKRSLITLGFGFLGFALASVWAFLQQGLLRMRQIPESAAKLDQVQEALRLRRGE